MITTDVCACILLCISQNICEGTSPAISSEFPPGIFLAISSRTLLEISLEMLLGFFQVFLLPKASSTVTIPAGLFFRDYEIFPRNCS